MSVQRWVDVLRQDLTYAWRNLRRTPAFTAVAVTSLALAIGANTAVFGLAHSMLFALLPLPHADRLVMLQRSAARGLGSGFSAQEFRALHDAHGITLTRWFSTTSTPIETAGTFDYATPDLVDGSYFDVLGIRALRGRLITDDDVRTHAPVVAIPKAPGLPQHGTAH